VKLAHFLRDGRTEVGLVDGEGIVPLTELRGKDRASPSLANIGSIDELLSKGYLEELAAVDLSTEASVHIPIRSAALKSPILTPEKILCAAVNYFSHGKEQTDTPPEAPYFFAKFRNTIIGPGEPIVIPRISKKADWEAELAVVIGKRGKYISKSEALGYVAGYTVSNDVSFRDLLFHEGLRLPPRMGNNWLKGKALDGALPLGPWLVTRDEVVDPQDLDVSLRVNGVIRQNSNTKEMVFGVDSLIEEASKGMTLEPGDVILTGTPAGVAFFSGAPFLKSGDVVEAEIEGIGVLRNPVRQE
jgi:2-keto-4-pentenoate hydratase/2-oxohepta-3-ene-1,7-dioic acid hydratase in catechol pathway